MAPSAVVRKSLPAASRSRASRKPANARVLIEFPSAALERADEAARVAGVSRSEFIRTSVELRLAAISEADFDRELAEACIANSARNLEMLKEFEYVDRDAWASLP